MSYYQFSEKCGCGASLTAYSYGSPETGLVERFRTGHRHIEPMPIPPVVVRVPRGTPRLRASRRFRRTVLPNHADRSRDE